MKKIDCFLHPRRIAFKEDKIFFSINSIILFSFNIVPAFPLATSHALTKPSAKEVK